MRKMFSIPEEDSTHLNSLGFDWETIVEGKTQWLILRKWKIPAGYRQQEGDIALQIPPSYPITQIDMAYFYPPLELISRATINATNTFQNIDGQKWQRWSRHRGCNDRWDQELDNIATHLIQVEHWLKREVKG